ncbi:MAG: alpha/beta fold hydrolase [Fluviicola sp.]
MERKVKLYCLSGLGVDHRAFLEISLPKAEMVHVAWIPPKKKETLTDYAKRLFDETSPEENYWVIGVSFGGMIAQEWAKISAPEQLVLISSTHDQKHIKPILRIPGKLGVHRLLHPKIATIFAPLVYSLFGAKKREEKLLLKAILNDTDPNFLRWATGALLQWSSEPSLTSINIHGKNDKMITSPERIDLETEGGHFTIFSEGEEISQFLSAKIDGEK